MKHIIHNLSLFLFCIILLINCSHDNSELKQKKKKLKEKKAELKTLKSEIKKLNKKINKLDTSKKKRKRILVSTNTIRYKNFKSHFNVTGAVEAAKNAIISSEIPGNIENIAVKEGDRVQKGALIAKINTSVMEKNLQELKTKYDHAKTIYKKQKRLWKEREIGSEMEFLNAKNKKESLKNRIESLKKRIQKASLKAPFTGIVDNVFQKEGNLANPAKPFARILNLNKLYINAEVAESHIKKIDKRDTVLVKFNDLGIKQKAPIVHISNFINPNNRTFKIKVKIHNTNDQLIKPNATGVIKINDVNIDKAIILPTECILRGLKGQFVFTVNSNNKAVKKYIETGPTNNDHTLITKGLEKGEKVVTKGYEDLSEGVLVRNE